MTITTRYFDEQVLRKRPYLTLEMYLSVLANPIAKNVQDDERIRHWGPADLQGDPETRILRVVTLEDGETIHNAFFDRNFSQDSQ